MVETREHNQGATYKGEDARLRADAVPANLRTGYVPVRSFVLFCAGIAACVGGVVLAGWLAGVPGLTTIWIPGDNPVRAPTAVAFLCAAGALLASMRERESQAIAYITRLILGALVAAIGVGSLGERLVGSQTWIAGLPVSASALRMSTNTAVALVALGVSLLSPRSGEHGMLWLPTGVAGRRSGSRGVGHSSVAGWRWWLAQFSAVVAVLIGYIALIGHAYNTPQFYRFASEVVISIPSAVCVLVLALASLVREPDAAFASEILNRRGGGVLFRSLVLIGAVVVPCLGWLRLSAQQRGEIDLELGLALSAASNVVLLGAAVWVSARRLNQSEGSLIFASNELSAFNSTLEERVRQRTDELRNSEHRFRLLADTAPAIIWMCDATGQPEYINRAGTVFFDMPTQDVPKAALETLAHAEDRPAATQTARESFTKRAPYEVLMRLRRADGEYRWLHQRAVTRTDTSGRFLGYIGVCVDMTEMHVAREQLQEALANREVAFEREQSLRRELDHRVRNNLAGLLGLVMFYESAATARGEGGDSFVASAVRGKIQAMKDVHELIAHAGGRSVSLGGILDRLVHAMTPKGAVGRIVTNGDRRITVPAQQAAALAMIFQELLTNSCKYGVLREGIKGMLNVDWKRDEAGRGVITWEESGVSEEGRGADLAPSGAKVEPPRDEGSGLGLRLIEGFAKSDLRGGAEFERGNGWWKCTLHMNDLE
jgi:PAS domain S-box-containing protein